MRAHGQVPQLQDRNSSRGRTEIAEGSAATARKAAGALGTEAAATAIAEVSPTENQQ